MKLNIKSKKSLPKVDWDKFHRLRFKTGNFSRRADKIEKTALKHAQKFVIKKWDKIKDIRVHILRWGLLIAVLLLALGTQVFVGQLAYRTKALGSGGSFREGSVGSFDSLNPLYASTKSELLASQLIFSRLYSFDDDGKLKGDLAKSITVSPDERVYTVTIRDDAMWHDGHKLTAEDIKFTVDLIKNPAVRSSLGRMWEEIEIRKLGDYSVEFILPSAYAPFMEALTFAVMPKHLLDNVEVTQLRESVFSKNPIGSGPMNFQSLRLVTAKSGRKQVLHLATNHQYYNAQAKVDRIELHAYSTQYQLAAALEEGELNAASNVDLPAIHNLPVWRLSAARLNNGVFAFLNNDRNHLREPKFRVAIRQVLNLQEIRNNYNLQNGVHSSLDYPITEAQLWGAELAPLNFFNPAEAEADLIELGYKNDSGKWLDVDGNPVKLSIATVKNSNYSSLADSITAQLRDFGLTIQLILIDLSDQSFNFVRSIIQPRNYDILIYEIELGSDPDQFVYWHSSQKAANSFNLSNYANSAVDDLLATARGKNDKALRQAKYKLFISHWLDDAPAIGLIQANLNYAVTKDTNAFDTKNILVDQESRFNDLSGFSVHKAVVYSTP